MDITGKTNNTILMFLQNPWTTNLAIEKLKASSGVLAVFSCMKDPVMFLVNGGMDDGTLSKCIG